MRSRNGSIRGFESPGGRGLHCRGDTGKRSVAREILHLEIVGVHVIAGGDVSFGKSDDLTVLAHGRTVGDRLHRYFVAGGNIPTDRQMNRIIEKLRPGADGPLDDGHVV